MLPLGMEESGSEGLDELIEREAGKFFKGVDCVCISDNYWLNDRTVSTLLRFSKINVAFSSLCAAMSNLRTGELIQKNCCRRASLFIVIS